MTEEEIIKICKDLIEMKDYKFQCNYTTKERNQAIQDLLDLYNKQQNKIASQEKQIKLMQSCDLAKVIKEQEKEIERLKNYSELYYLECEKYENFISKDKIKDILLKFQNKYDGYLETTDKLFIGKEVLQYGEDILDEIAAELDIKLLEE